MKKRFFTLVITFIMMLSTVASASNIPAKPVEALIRIDGVTKKYAAYIVYGNTYFKLRDLAQLFSGTAKQFDVTWDSALNAISLTTGKKYSGPVENSIVGTEKQVAALSTNNVYLDSRFIRLTGYRINDNNYFKIRDLAEVMKFQIDYDSGDGAIIIKTEASAQDFGYGQIDTFTTKDMNGNSVNNSAFSGKPVTFIHYWATWCGPCRNELPIFDGLYDKYKDKVNFITIIDDGQNNKTAEKYVQDYLSSYTNLLPDENLLNHIRTGYVPTTVIVNEEGYLVVDKIPGSIGSSAYSNVIEQALKAVQ